MYSTCVFCNQSLGSNGSIETFPVGRRLAFDAAKGRLWAVCRKCERWNLAPIEERWEAVEECERLFRGTRMRASTENVGLARLAEGLELVRIGAPLRPEFAAWRYGDQFGRRRRRTIIMGTGALVGLGAVAVGGIVVGAISSSLLAQSGNFVNAWMNGRTLLRLSTDDGVLKLKRQNLMSARVETSEQGEWTLRLSRRKKQWVFQGAEAERVAGLVIPKLNRMGGSRRAVRDAVRLLEHHGGPAPFLREVVHDTQLRTAPRPSIPATGHDAQSHEAPAVIIPPRHRADFAAPGSDEEAPPALFKAGHLPGGRLAKLPTATRLAFEMALHEEQERRALQGELVMLEAAWRRAEEIASIADELLIPADADRFVAEHRVGGEGEAS